MNIDRQGDTSYLFLVRVRARKTGERPQPEDKRWYGRVQRVVTGETYDFRGWAELVDRLGLMLEDSQAGNDIDE